VQVPTWKPSSPWSNTGFDGLIASDLPYALANNADLLPDLAIGRMPAPNLAVANDEVAKIVAYEDSPPAFAGDFYNHATVTSYFQCGLDVGGQPCNPGTRDERTFSKLSETVRNGMLAAGKTVDRVYTTTAVTPQQFYDGTALPAALLEAGVRVERHGRRRHRRLERRPVPDPAPGPRQSGRLGQPELRHRQHPGLDERCEAAGRLQHQLREREVR